MRCCQPLAWLDAKVAPKNHSIRAYQWPSKKIYKTPKDYYNKEAQRYDELVKEGWALPVYRAMVLEAARVTF